MPTFIKPGFWEKTKKGYAHWLNLDLLIQQASVSPTLQQVLINNHDLVDGKNFQGTNAGLNNTGTNQINAFGGFAASSNSGYEINAFGSSAAQSNSGRDINAFGSTAGLNNAADNVNAFGNQSSVGNTGNNLNAFGYFSGNQNRGVNVNAFGSRAGWNNKGNSINAFGFEAGFNNEISGATIFSNASMPTFANHAAAALAITVALGASANCTYLYHNQATNSIGAVRL